MMLNQSQVQPQSPKIAIIHDWLYIYAGAERVLEQIIHCFPSADIFSLIDFIPEHDRGFLHNKPVTTSFIQKLPFAKTKHRNYIFLCPLAIEQFDLSSYDIIISSSHAVAKGVLTSPNQIHICYCHSPMRYAWDMQHQYLQEANLSRGFKSWIARYMLHKIRLWDYRTANGVDYFIANSNFIAKRIFKVYRRDATVINPGVDTLHIADIIKINMNKSPKEDYFLAASRLVPYKHIPLIAKAFKEMPDKKLIVIGDGSQKQQLLDIISNAPNITYLGHQTWNDLISYLHKARALVFASEEDFGILPLEAQACGTPVIAYGKGGSLETVRGLDIASPTGMFFNEQSIEAIINAVNKFTEINSQIKIDACINNANNFTNEIFRDKFKNFVLDKYINFKNSNI